MRIKYTAVAASFVALSVATPAVAQTMPEREIERIEILRLTAPEGDVDAGNPTAWVNIGVNPFQGDLNVAAQVLSAKTAFNPSDIFEGGRMRSQGLCIRRDLQNKDELRTTFGEDGSMLATVAFAPGKPRGADNCLVRIDPDTDGDGLTTARAVVFPDGCTNGSAATAHIRITYREAPPPPPAAAAPPPRVVVPSVTTTFTPSVRSTDHDGIVIPLFVPGARYAGGDTILRSGSKARNATATAVGAGACATSTGGGNNPGC